MKPKRPYTIRRLWGIWIPGGGEDKRGRWMRTGRGAVESLQVYTSKAAALTDAIYYADIPGCYAAPLTEAAKGKGKA